MERAEIFIAGRIDVHYELVTTVMPGTTLYSVQNKRKDYDVRGKLIYVIKHYEDFIYYELFDGYSGDIVMRNRTSDGSFCIVMLVPKDKPFDNGVSPYTVLMSVYKHFCDNYMEKITVDNSIDKRTFKANRKKNFWLDNYETLTKEIYGILAKYPLKKDFKITEYYPMNPSGKVCRLKIPENELKAFFLDSHSEYKDFSAIHFSTDYEGPCDNIPREKKQEQSKTEKADGSSLSETKNVSSTTNDKKPGSASDMNNIQLKRIISAREETIGFCLDKISEIIDKQKKNENQKATKPKPNDDSMQEVESYFETNFQAIADIISDKDETISKGKKFLVASLSVAAVLLIAVIMLAVNLGNSSGESVISIKNDGGSYVKVLTYINNSTAFVDSLRVKRKTLDDTLKSLGLCGEDIKLAKFYIEEFPKLPEKRLYSVNDTINVIVEFPKISLSTNSLSWSELSSKYIEMDSLYVTACKKAKDDTLQSLFSINTEQKLLKVFCEEGLSNKVLASEYYKSLDKNQQSYLYIINAETPTKPFAKLNNMTEVLNRAKDLAEKKICEVINTRPDYNLFLDEVPQSYRDLHITISTVEYAAELILENYDNSASTLIEKKLVLNKPWKNYKFKSVQDMKNKASVIRELKEKSLL